ncbi:MAG: glycosyltransferase family 9 protein [Alphaproteobacteria bacterium]
MEHTRPAAVLVIKLGALGDFVQAMGAFKAIRAHHGDARITLLTTAPYAGLGEACGYFDEVWIDSRPGLWRPRDWLVLAKKLRGGGFARVYDLQTSDRTNAYFRLFGWRRRPEWSGVAWGCSHPHVNPRRNRMHPVECQAEQLAVAGIAEVPEIDLSWAAADLGRFDLVGRFALLVPGASAHRPEKRWPAAQYAVLATRLAGQGVRSVLIGAAAERGVLAEVVRGCPGALDLCGRTAFGEIVELARRAVVAVGNDTGPMHLIAGAGCPSVVLYSSASDPARTAPRGRCVAILRRPRLAELPCDEVIAALPSR